MNLAIDSYCYHRYFGEWYPEIQQDPGRRITIWDFLKRISEIGVAGVSIDSHYLEPVDDLIINRLRETLEEFKLDLVWGWGHWLGLSSGDDLEAAKDLVRHLRIARRLGAKVMRICAGGWRTRPASWSDHKAKLIPMLRNLIHPAEEQGVIVAMENHLDLTADEMVEVITTINSPWLKVCLDTANNLRMGEDPIYTAKALAPFTKATHIKDLALTDQNPESPYSWGSVPLGKGVINLPAILGFLRRENYKGQLAVEIDYLHPKYREGEDKAVVESLAYLREIIS